MQVNTLIVWAERQNIILNFIQPGKPQQNAYIERYNRTVRYDWLGHYLFYSLSEVTGIRHTMAMVL
ncbi:transposase [Klebsiella pneumoniae]|nr:transposase [Klebsiella pneumoniae]